MRAHNPNRRALLLLVMWLGSASVEAQALSKTLPEGPPPAATLAEWERADGQAEEGDWAVVYSLYVNPLRPGLYEVTRFRVDRLEPPAGARRAAETEKLLWNSRPGTREPLVCYERAPHRNWRTLWLRRWKWRPLRPGTAAYQQAMLTAIKVYGLHRARLGLPPPA